MNIQWLNRNCSKCYLIKKQFAFPPQYEQAKWPNGQTDAQKDSNS